jgi:hypothetical protein
MENFWANTQLCIGFEYSGLTELKWYGNETARSGHTTNRTIWSHYKPEFYFNFFKKM